MKNLLQTLIAIAFLLQSTLAIVPAHAGVITPPFNPANSQPQLAGIDLSLLPKWRAAMAKVVAGVGYARIAIIGDSTSMGAGCGTGSGGVTGNINAKVCSWPAQLKRMFPNLNVIDESWFGNNNEQVAATPAGLSQYDPRLTFDGSSWDLGATTFGKAFLRNLSGTDSMHFAPTTPVDTCDIYYYQNGSNGTFTVTDASGTLATYNSSGTSTEIRVNFTRTVASTAIFNIQRTTGGQISVGGMDCWNSKVSSVRILNGAIFGATTTTWVSSVSNAFDPLNVLGVIAPDLTIVDLGINDSNANLAVGTYTTNMQTIITKGKLSGDAAILRPQPTQTPTFPANLPAYQSAQYGLAATNKIPLFDLTARFVSYTQMSAEYYDGIHMLANGYADFAILVEPLFYPFSGYSPGRPLITFSGTLGSAPTLTGSQTSLYSARGTSGAGFCSLVYTTSTNTQVVVANVPGGC